MRTFALRLVGLLSIGLGASGPSLAQSGGVDAIAAALKQGGYVIVLRHAATHRDQADTDPLRLENVSAQRQLSEEGKRQASSIGAAFKALQIPLGAVHTSRFQRAIETAALVASKEPKPLADISEGGLVVTPIENERRAEALRRLVAVVPASGTNTLIVTHKPNILDAFGKEWFEVKEGEASVFKPDGSGKAPLLGRVQAADWERVKP